MTNSIDPNRWNFDEIRGIDPERAEKLENAGSPDDLIFHLEECLRKSVENCQLRLAVDSIGNEFTECRSIVQFRVSPELYDWFFNARTGYRAQFWINPDDGRAFNEQLTQALRDVLALQLTSTVVTARLIELVNKKPRKERDIGERRISVDRFIASLSQTDAKIWICERLYSHEASITDIRSILIASPPSAIPVIDRWRDVALEAGLRAPYPNQEHSWLDLKGGFIGPDGKANEGKSQIQRAQDIHDRGWTG